MLTSPLFKKKRKGKEKLKEGKRRGKKMRKAKESREEKKNKKKEKQSFTLGFLETSGKLALRWLHSCPASIVVPVHSETGSSISTLNEP